MDYSTTYTNQQAGSWASDENAEIQVRFETQQKKYSVTDKPFSVPTRLKRYGLSEVINHLLQLDPPRPFDFLIDGEFIRSSLEKYIVDHQLSRETIIKIEYCEAVPPPTPLNSYEHDDWVSSIAYAKQSGLFLTGSYDASLRIWNQGGKCLGTFTDHAAAIKCVAIVNAEVPDANGNINSEAINCVTGSLDHTILSWQITNNSSNVDANSLHVFKGHTSTVDCIAAHPSVALICSGSFDKSLKLWSLKEIAGEEIQQPSKKSRLASNKSASSVTKSELRSLLGHTDAVTGVSWPIASNLHSTSLDASVRIWDVETGVNSSTMNGPFPSLCIASNNTGTIVTGHTDGGIRVWDPRKQDGVVVKLVLKSHKGFVSSVSWSPSQPTQLVSGSYDNSVKIWDIRSKLPLFTVSEHTDRVLSVYYAESDLIASGSVDKTLKLTINQ